MFGHDEFLTSGPGDVTLNYTGAWKNILAHENLTPGSADALAALKNNSPPSNTNDNVLLTAGPQLLGLSFSSERNEQFFVQELPTGPDSRANNAWIGDLDGSGVMLLQPVDTTSSAWPKKLVDEVCTAFGLDPTKDTPIHAFLTAIDDATSVLKVVTSEAPDWQDKTNWILNHTIESVRQNNMLLPTNAVWCETINDVYTLTANVSFDLGHTVGIVVNKALSFISANFDGLTPQSLATPPPSLNVALTRVSRYGLDNTSAVIDDSKVSRSMMLSFAFQILNFNIYIDLTETEHKLLLTPAVDEGIGSLIKSTLSAATAGRYVDMSLVPDGNTSDRNNPDTNPSNIFSQFFDHFRLWYINVDYDSGRPSGSRLDWRIGIIAVWIPKASVSIAVSVTYDSEMRAFSGRLLRDSDLPDPIQLRSSVWDPWLDPSNLLAISLNVDVAKLPIVLAGGVDLFDLAGLDPDSQPAIPHILRTADVYFSRPGTAGFTFKLNATLTTTSTPVTAAGGAPEGGLSWDTASVDLAVSSTDNSKKDGSKLSYDIDLFSSFRLLPDGSSPDLSSIDPATFTLELHGSKTATSGPDWLLRGTAQDLSVGLLASFFDKDGSRDGAMAVMSKLTLASLELIYTYQKATASSFLITGVLRLGSLELDLSYQYVSTLVGMSDTTATSQYLNDNPDGGKLPKGKDDQFITGNKDKKVQSKFVASLSATSPGSTVASIAESIKPGAADSLPEWVGGIMVNPTTTSGNAPIAELEFNSQTTTAAGKKGNVSVLTVWLNIDGFNLTLIQFRSAVKNAEATEHAATMNTGALKRILRISVDQIPLMDDIPLVGQLPQPFDHLEYVWVEDETAGVDSTFLGITRSELEQIKGLAPDNIPAIQVMDSNPPTDNTTPDIVLQAGHHFIVVVKGKVVLDHVFETNKASTQPQNPTTTTTSSLSNTKELAANVEATKTIKTTTVTTATEPPDPPPTKGNTNTQVGPLSISALAFQFKNPSLLVSVDATLTLGTLAFSVIGFTLQIELGNIKLNDLSGIVTNGWIHASLHGIDCGLNKPPLTLLGNFIHDETEAMETYSGGIAVGFEAWQVLAVGQYTIAKTDGYRAVFVYGKLDGPLIELEFATISGVRLGFGYNYAVKMPGLDDLYTFPFISDSVSSGAGADPMNVLNAMVFNEPHFVYPKDGSCWFCAGMTITAFDTLTLTAVLLVDITTAGAGVDIAMLADGVFQMEPQSKPDLSLFYIEIVLSVEMNFTTGYIAATAVMAPSSHVYVPQAKLVGGASLYTWFGNNAHAGDWVVSVGGYARGYDRPLHYPNPDRVGLDFTVGDMIHVTGTGYLAVTPKCAMAGGTLHMSLGVGPVTAYCDVVLDAYINFKPFHFRAEISLSVGVQCEIDILFIHIHISVSIGADLTIWGPNEFGGHAHVDFWFFGFGIDFGADENPDATKAVSLPDFYAMVKAPGPASAPPKNDTIGTNTDVCQHKYSVEAGLIPASTPAADADAGNNFPSTGATTEWQVQAGTLQVRIDCDFALSDAHMRTRTATAAAAVPGQPDPASSAPINLPANPDGSIRPVPPVYSWPMHSKPANNITSSLEIAVYEIQGAGGEEQLATGFRAELVLKSAAPALWSAYDSSRDPLVHPRPPDLADGGAATLALVQAVRLLPPLPVLYPSLIVDFDATAAMREDISGTYTLPVEEPQGGRFAGGYFEPDAADGDVEAQVARWGDFEKAWNPAAVHAPVPSPDTVAAVRAGVVESIAGVLEWTVRPPSQMVRNAGAAVATATAAAGSAPAQGRVAPTPNVPRVNADGRTDWELVADQPTLLVQQLDKYYPALPFVLAT